MIRKCNLSDKEIWCRLNQEFMRLEHKMKKEGFKRIQLMAEDTNPGAVSFYEKEEYLKQRIHFFCKYI